MLGCARRFRVARGSFNTSLKCEHIAVRALPATPIILRRERWILLFIFVGGGGENHRPNRKEKNRVIIILCMYIRREKLDQWPQRGEVLFLKKKIYWNVYSRAGMYVVTHRKCIKMTSSTIPRAVTFRSIYLIRTIFFFASRYNSVGRKRESVSVNSWCYSRRNSHVCNRHIARNYLYIDVK